MNRMTRSSSERLDLKPRRPMNRVALTVEICVTMEIRMMKSLPPLLLGLVMAAGCLLLPACGSGEEPGSSELAVTVSIPPQAYLVERIAGPDVKIVTLVRGGESPATYQPTDQQVSEVMRSRIYFRLGVPFERAAG
jgi:hypothetical protein